MCTVTWWRAEDGFRLFFNRDELRSRKEALPPFVQEASAPDGSAVRFLAPVDGDFGGTWVAVNERGLTLGLLNGYRAPDAVERPDTRSRGLLVRDLASCATGREVVRRLRGEDLRRYRSFRLLAIEPGTPALLAEWDLLSVEVRADAEGRLPLISSSFEETLVGRRRREEYGRSVGEEVTPERLDAYHHSHAGGPSAYSVCMHRPDALTRSLTSVRVEGREIELVYHPGSPCRASRETTVRLPRTELPAP
jgi:hypothetical protein